MHELTRMIKDDMVPALGVTEPGAIAFCAAKARSLISGELVRLEIIMNSGMYKNADTCCIPNSRGFGSARAAALGFVAGDPEKGLNALASATPEDDALAERYVRQGLVVTTLGDVSSRISIRALLETSAGAAEVAIQDTHTNIAYMAVNGEAVYEAPEAAAEPSAEAEEPHRIHAYTLKALVDYVNNVPYEEIAFVMDAYKVNLALFEAGMRTPGLRFGKKLLAMNGGEVISRDERRSASLLCNAAIEARVMGVPMPAMSITGSGAHGIIATLPLYAVVKINRLSEEQLCRATMLSYLVCTYIKEYSGRLSAFCGCGIAAGSGMAVALCWLKGGSLDAMAATLNNMASSITGMICDGGNQGCVMKGVAACATAFDSVELALGDAHVDGAHGINGPTPEATMRNMGLIASPGMVHTEETILRIQQEKK
ncbi:MAG: L-serine ammonia-lyase, iron-sulfur-dependent, subunit alpha [Clostridia bacterium]|nr:L-serine ammonia-lyase, iron-sulfur-dependent, subunit alpha [Clostridia bacterium]